MRRFGLFVCCSMLSSLLYAATPIDGWYYSVFGGYTYVPDNISATQNGITYSDANYEYGYDVGGSFGYKSNPMRYEGEVSYINAPLESIFENGFKNSDPSGYNNVVTGLVNVYYDFPNAIQTLNPFLGVGLGYAWVSVKVDNQYLPNTPDFKVSDSAFAYQGIAGITFNFAENYALSIQYKYLNTNDVFGLGKTFQAHFANASAIYRYDDAKYK